MVLLPQPSIVSLWWEISPLEFEIFKRQEIQNSNAKLRALFMAFLVRLWVFWGEELGFELDLALDREMLHHLCHTASPLSIGYFSKYGLPFMPRLTLNQDPPHLHLLCS
jgi:hypothetical protein